MEPEIQVFLDSVKSDLQEEAPALKESIEKWGLVIGEIYAKKYVTKDERALAQLAKDEQYAWNAVQSLKARFAKKVETKSWEIAEKAAVLLRKILLSSLLG